MFRELMPFVNLLRSVLSDYSKKKSTSHRNEIISKMLETYFYLKDAVDEGEALVNDAQPNPVEIISSLPPDDAKMKLLEWHYALRRQGFRLHRISENIFGQEFMDIASPDLREKLHDAIGSKFNRATSLHGIGAALFFRDMFPLENSDEEKARYISVMAGEEDDLLNIEKIRSEISELRPAMDSYHEAIKLLASSDEIIKLTKEARIQTSLPKSPGGA